MVPFGARSHQPAASMWWGALNIARDFAGSLVGLVFCCVIN